MQVRELHEWQVRGTDHTPNIIYNHSLISQHEGIYWRSTITCNPPKVDKKARKSCICYLNANYFHHFNHRYTKKAEADDIEILKRTHIMYYEENVIVLNVWLK